MEIGIIGVGWLGSSLLQKVKNEKMEYCGTRFSTKDIDNNIFQFEIGDELNSTIKQSETIVISVPPRLRRKNQKEQQAIIDNHKNLFEQINENTHIIYTSSTSVYEETGNLNEKSNCNGTLYEIENLIRNRFKKHLILRLGGLAGGNRTIVNILSKKGIINGYNLPTNLLHLEDATNALFTGIKNQATGTYNICSSDHPNKWTVYTNWIERLNFNKVIKGEESEKNKTINNELYIKEQSFTYKYESPLDFNFDF